MKNSYKIIISIFLFVAFVIALISWYGYNSDRNALMVEPAFFCYKVSSISVFNSEINDSYSSYSGIINITQGAYFEVNLTVTSLSFQELTVPLRAVTYVYNNTFGWNFSKYKGANNGYYTYAVSFSLNSLTLEPAGSSNSTVISIYTSSDTPKGTYLLSIQTGNITVNNPRGISPIWNAENIGLGMMIVNPK